MTHPRDADLIEMSKGLYLTIVGLTESPREGMALITMIHLTMYMNHCMDDTTVDDMLTDYVRNFKHNWNMNKAKAS